MYYERFYRTDEFEAALVAFAERLPGEGWCVLKALKVFRGEKARRETVLRSSRGREFHLLPYGGSSGQWLLLVEAFEETIRGRKINALKGHRFATYASARAREDLVGRFTIYAEDSLGI